MQTRLRDQRTVRRSIKEASEVDDENDKRYQSSGMEYELTASNEQEGEIMQGKTGIVLRKERVPLLRIVTYGKRDALRKLELKRKHRVMRVL